MDKYQPTLAWMYMHARLPLAQWLKKPARHSPIASPSRTFSGDGREHELLEWLKKLPGPIRCAYESGCTGTHLARDLRKLGYDCDVIAVSTLARSSKDKKAKCDKHDAKILLREILNPMASYSTVWVPDAQTEADRSLVRAYRDAVDECKRAKQKLESFFAPLWLCLE